VEVSTEAECNEEELVSIFSGVVEDEVAGEVV